MDEGMDENGALKVAVEAARQSPCAKSNRGVIIWKRDWPPWVAEYFFVTGHNHPPEPMKCDGSEACRAACNKLCIHAETDALFNFGRWSEPEEEHEQRLVDGFEMLHVKVVDGAAVPSGQPSCWQCSRDILAVQLKAMWLLHEDGLRSYTPLEFHELTLRHHGLPIIR